MVFPTSGDFFTSSTISFAVGGVLTYLLWSKVSSKNRNKEYPPFPGPPGLPVIGNIHQIGKHQHLKYTGEYSTCKNSQLDAYSRYAFTEWHAQYGS